MSLRVTGLVKRFNGVPALDGVDLRVPAGQVHALLGHGEILAVGTSEQVRSLAGPATRTIDLAGRTVLPGINDSHLHGAAYGLSRPPFALDLAYPGVQSIADVTEAVRAAAACTPPGTWIIGVGWDLGYLRECADGGRIPHRRDLDLVTPGHPVCLNDFSAHMVWVNTAALRIAGITSGGAAPDGGVIDAADDGQPTGLLRESAQALVQRHLPQPTMAQRRQAMRSSCANCTAGGSPVTQSRVSVSVAPRPSSVG